MAATIQQPKNSEEAAAVIRKLTPAQRRDLDALCLGGEYISRKIGEKLAAKGLVNEGEQTLPGRFPVIVKFFVVPTFVHIAWCEVCEKEGWKE